MIAPAERHRQQHRDRGAPQKRHDQQPRRLRLPPVQPQVAQQHARHRQAGQREAQDSPTRVDRGEQAQDQSRDGAQRDDGSEWCADFADRPRKGWPEAAEECGVGHHRRVAAGAPEFVRVVIGRVGSSSSRVLFCGTNTRKPVPTINCVRSNPTICPVPPSPRRK